MARAGRTRPGGGLGFAVRYPGAAAACCGATRAHGPGQGGAGDGTAEQCRESLWAESELEGWLFVTAVGGASFLL